MIYLISPSKKQYKANLHCHSVLSDGKKTPLELKEMYKNEGYQILSITDHERPANHTAMNDDSFLMLTGYEAYIRPDPNGKYNAYNKEIHLNLFAKDPKNVSLICFNEPYCRYVIRDNALDTLVKAGSQRQREYTREYINDFIKTANENGYLVAYNHPYWSMEDEADILSYEGLFSLEICNYGSYIMNKLEHASALYDKFLIQGNRIFCHAADDNHNASPLYSDSFGAFTMIMPSEFTYSGVIEAMERGEMYASMGPTFKEISFDGETIHVECSEVESIIAYFGGKRPKYIHALGEEKLTCADIEIDPNARYVRISAIDEKGRFADTRGYSLEELGITR